MLLWHLTFERELPVAVDRDDMIKLTVYIIGAVKCYIINR
jgi:hypothetical protein